MHVFETNFTGQILSACSGDVRQIKAAIIKVDKEQRLVKCSEKDPLIVDVAERVGWSRLWDLTSELGLKAVSGLQMLSRALGHHGEGQWPCHLCDAGPLQEIRLIDHILEEHWKELHLYRRLVLLIWLLC